MKRHTFDGISFFAGLVIAIIGLAFLIPYRPTDLIHLLGKLGGWLLAIFLVAVGLAVLGPAISKIRQED